MGWYWNLLRSLLITAAAITTNAVHYETSMLSEGLLLSVNLLFCYLPTVSVCHKIHKIFQGLQPRMATMARGSSGKTPGWGLSHSVHSAGASSQRTLTSSGHGDEVDVHEYV